MFQCISCKRGDVVDFSGPVKSPVAWAASPGASGGKKKEPTFLFAGLDRAGKTSLLGYVQHNHMILPAPTLSESSRTKVVLDAGYGVTIVDVSGKNRGAWMKCAQDCAALVFVIDGLDPLRLALARSELRRLLSGGLGAAPLLVVLNKVDAPHCMSLDDVKSGLRLAELAHPRCTVMSASALEGTGLREIVVWLRNVG